MKFIEIPAQEALITGYSEASVEQLFDFGKLVATDAHQLLSQLDSKLGAYLGFCAALIGLISVGLNGKETSATKWGMAISIGLIVLAIISSLVGLYTRTFLMPSESDWFCEELFERPIDLKRHHVISLLSSHQHALEIGYKGAMVAQSGIPFGGWVNPCRLYNNQQSLLTDADSGVVLFRFCQGAALEDHVWESAQVVLAAWAD